MLQDNSTMNTPYVHKCRTYSASFTTYLTFV